VPDKAYDVLNIINETGAAPDGFKGGRQFLNNGRGDGQAFVKIGLSWSSPSIKNIISTNTSFGRSNNIGLHRDGHFFCSCIEFMESKKRTPLNNY